MQRNRLILVVLAIVLLVAAYVIVDRFADPATRARLYGGASSGDAPPAARGTPSRP